MTFRQPDGYVDVVNKSFVGCFQSQSLKIVSAVTLMMTSAQVVETSVTVTNNSPFQDYPHPDDYTTRSKGRNIVNYFAERPTYYTYLYSSRDMFSVT